MWIHLSCLFSWLHLCFCLLSVPFSWEFSPTVGQVKFHLFFKRHQKLSESSYATQNFKSRKAKKVLQTALLFLSLLAEMWENWSCFLLLWYKQKEHKECLFFFFSFKNNQSFFENIEGQCLSALFLLMWWEILDF